MSGLKQRIFRRRVVGRSRQGAAGLLRRVSRRRQPAWPGRPRRRLSWRSLTPRRREPRLGGGDGPQDLATLAEPSFRDRGRLRRRLRFLRRARELGFRDVGGLVFDMRRFDRDRPDLLDAKLGALATVDQELRTLEVVLNDRRFVHELREPGISSCPRCGALHGSEANFCPLCGLQLGGPRAMGEIGGAIAAPPQAPAAPAEHRAPPSPSPASSLAGETQPTEALTPPPRAPDGS